jgi:hypothetical protein
VEKTGYFFIGGKLSFWELSLAKEFYWHFASGILLLVSLAAMELCDCFAEPTTTRLRGE